MSQTHADFAVLGASPQARLVAGLLASVHGKTVVFRGESQSGYRLPRGIDLSVDAITRPESWALLQDGVPETTKLLARIGKRGMRARIDPIIFADGAAARDALAHVRHMAQGFKLAVERVPTTLLGPGREGIVLRDAVLLHRATLEPALDGWLDQHKVRRLDGSESFTLNADGSAVAEVGDEQITIGQTILADDTAILNHLPADAWPSLLVRQISTTILTEPTAPIAAPVMRQLDSGLTLTQHAERGLVAMGRGSIDQFAASLGILLGPDRSFRQAGQSSYTSVITADGAPAVGRVRGGPDVLAGFGATGAFLAPAIARWLCGAGSSAENAWLGARLVDRNPAASSVADIGDGA